MKNLKCVKTQADSVEIDVPWQKHRLINVDLKLAVSDYKNRNVYGGFYVY